MKKEKFHIILETNSIKDEYSVLGNYDNNMIEYYESNKLRSKIIIDLNDKTLVKDNIDYKITLNLNNNKNGIIYLKKEEHELELKLKIETFSFKNNKLIMIYNIIDSNELVKYEITIGG